MPDGKWRLGNEEDTKIELIPTVTLKSTSGAVAKIQANITHQSKCTADWNCRDDDGHDAQFREGFVELTNLDFAPDITFWAGKRYSSSNLPATSTTGNTFSTTDRGGFDHLDLGFASLDAGLCLLSNR
jgi:sucrose porin